MEKLHYNVAGHFFCIAADAIGHIPTILPSFAPFNVQGAVTEKLLFEMRIVDTIEVCGTEINRFQWDAAECVIFQEGDSYTFVLYPNNEDTSYVMSVTSDFSQSVVSSNGGLFKSPFVLNNFLMMTYAFASASENTLMIHASVIRNNEKGYLFLGKSGTGKSTHSQLWLDYIPGSDLLNDDNPIVRVLNDSEVRVYGSPWSGKTPCYRNLSVPVGAVVRLYQAPQNKIEPLKSLVGFAEILSSCSVMKWDRRIYDGVCDTASTVALRVRSFKLHCLPDEEAAKLCYRIVNA